MSKIKYKLNGGWTELSAADINAATDSIIINETGSPTNSKNIKSDTKLYIDNTESNIDDNGTIIRVQTTNVTWPLSIDKGGTGTDSITNFINNIKAELFKEIYPVGSIYISMNDTNPGTKFGGTWTQIKGRFLAAIGDNGASGNQQWTVQQDVLGGESVHTLQQNECALPAHNHNFTQPTVKGSTATAVEGQHYHGLPGGVIIHPSSGGTQRLATSGSGTLVGLKDALNANLKTWGHTDTNTHKHTVSLTAAGGSVGTVTPTVTMAATAHNNIPPYFPVYMWQRTA